MKNFLIKLLPLLIILFLLITGFIAYNKISQYIETKNNKTVNLVFTTDKVYKDYLKVAIKSAIINKNPDTKFDINIFCVDLNEKEQKEYNVFEQEDVRVHIIPVTLDSIKNIGNYEIENVRVSRADLFKFVMPEVMRSYDKVLYIDCDTLILHDLLELFNTDISNKYLGAVYKYQPLYTWKKVFVNLYSRRLQYEYNCGVMLLNLKKMRKDKMSRKLIEDKNNDKNRVLMTQENFNRVIPIPKMKSLSPIYNTISRWEINDFDLYNFKRTYYPYLNKINSMEELYTKTVIVHYAGFKKPWTHSDIAFANVWRIYAKMVDPTWTFPETSPEDDE